MFWGLLILTNDFCFLSFLSTHPASDDRVEYLEQLIEHNGYNRYAFEGVEKHREIQENLK